MGSLQKSRRRTPLLRCSLLESHPIFFSPHFFAWYLFTELLWVEAGRQWCKAVYKLKTLVLGFRPTIQFSSTYDPGDFCIALFHWNKMSIEFSPSSFLLKMPFPPEGILACLVSGFSRWAWELSGHRDKREEERLAHIGCRLFVVRAFLGEMTGCSQGSRGISTWIHISGCKMWVRPENTKTETKRRKR